jgi:MOSC domain-containing protein YiiM
MTLALLSVNVAQPRVLAHVDGEPVLSAIGKQPVSGHEIRVLKETLDGDRVADPTVHGGADKAVYAYPADNWPWWESEHGFSCRPGAFGENLTVSGADEVQVRIGDRFAWGEAVLEVSQPRQPCFKFALHSGRPEAGTVMTLSGRCGWYFRVIEEGVAPVTGPLARILESDGPTVRETFIAAMHRRTSEEERRRIADHPALSRAFRAALLRRG